MNRIYYLAFKKSEPSHDVIVKFEPRLLDEYFKNENLRRSGLPQVRYFADKVCLSPNYFRRPCEKGNRHDRTGIYPKQTYPCLKRMGIEHPTDNQPDCIRIRIPIHPAFQPHFQEKCRLYASWIPTDAGIILSVYCQSEFRIIPGNLMVYKLKGIQDC